MKKMNNRTTGRSTPYLFQFLLLMWTMAVAKAVQCEQLWILGDSTCDEGNNDWVSISGLSHLGAPITNGNVTYTGLVAQHLGCSDKSEGYINGAYASATTGNEKQLYVNDLHKVVSVYDDQHECQQPGKVNDSFACVPTLYQQVHLRPASLNPSKACVILNGGGNDFFDDLISVLKPALEDVALQRDLQTILNHATDDWNTVEKVFAVMGKNSSSFSLPAKNLHQLSLLLQKKWGVPKQQILFMMLPKMSLVPAARSFTSNKLLINIIGLISEIYNHRLTSLLTRSLFSPYNLKSSNLYNVAELLNSIVKNPSQYNLTTVMEGCVDQTQEPECPGFMWFNGKHLTQQGHELLADDVTEHVTTQLNWSC